MKFKHIHAVVYLFAVCNKVFNRLLQVSSTAPSVATAMHWAPFQTVMPIAKGMVPFWPTSGETRIFSMAVCLDRARTLADWHHFGTFLFYFTHLNLLLQIAKSCIIAYFEVVMMMSCRIAFHDNSYYCYYFSLDKHWNYITTLLFLLCFSD